MVSKENNFKMNKENKILITSLIKDLRNCSTALAGYSMFRTDQITKVSLFLVKGDNLSVDDKFK